MTSIIFIFLVIDFGQKLSQVHKKQVSLFKYRAERKAPRNLSGIITVKMKL